MNNTSPSFARFCRVWRGARARRRGRYFSPPPPPPPPLANGGRAMSARWLSARWLAVAFALAAMLGISVDARAQDLTGTRSVGDAPRRASQRNPAGVIPSIPHRSHCRLQRVSASRRQRSFFVQPIGGSSNSSGQTTVTIGGDNSRRQVIHLSAASRSCVAIVTIVSGSPKTYTVTARTFPVAPTLETPTVLSRSLALTWTAPTDTGTSAHHRL